MDYKKSKAPVNTVTRNLQDLWKETGNIYESVAIIAKRANQISVEIKQDLSKKLAEFASYNDSLEEVFENREQIEISRYYEKLPRQHCSPQKSFWKATSTGATRPTTTQKTTPNDTAHTVGILAAGPHLHHRVHVPARRSMAARGHGPQRYALQPMDGDGRR